MRARLPGLIAVVLIVGGLTAAAPRSMSLFDTITAALLGSEGTYLQFIGTAVLYIGFAYLLTLPYAERRDTWMQLELLRRGSDYSWLTGMLRQSVVPAVMFPLGLGSAAAGWYIALGGRSLATPENGMPPWLFQLVANGALQILVYALVLLAATMATRNRVGGLAATAVLLVLALPRRQPMPLLPVQLSGMIYARGGWASTLPATATLLLTIALAATGVLLVLQHRRRTA